MHVRPGRVLLHSSFASYSIVSDFFSNWFDDSDECKLIFRR